MPKHRPYREGDYFSPEDAEIGRYDRVVAHKDGAEFQDDLFNQAKGSGVLGQEGFMGVCLSSSTGAGALVDVQQVSREHHRTCYSVNSTQQFKLSYGTEETDNLQSNSTAKDVEDALLALPSLTEGDVIVWGGEDELDNHWYIRFNGDPADLEDLVGLGGAGVRTIKYFPLFGRKITDVQLALSITVAPGDLVQCTSLGGGFGRQVVDTSSLLGRDDDGLPPREDELTECACIASCYDPDEEEVVTLGTDTQGDWPFEYVMSEFPLAGLTDENGGQNFPLKLQLVSGTDYWETEEFDTYKNIELNIKFTTKVRLTVYADYFELEVFMPTGLGGLTSIFKMRQVRLSQSPYCAIWLTRYEHKRRAGTGNNDIFTYLVEGTCNICLNIVGASSGSCPCDYLEYKWSDGVLVPENIWTNEICWRQDPSHTTHPTYNNFLYYFSQHVFLTKIAGDSVFPTNIEMAPTGKGLWETSRPQRIYFEPSAPPDYYAREDGGPGGFTNMGFDCGIFRPGSHALIHPEFCNCPRDLDGSPTFPKFYPNDYPGCQRTFVGSSPPPGCQENGVAYRLSYDCTAKQGTCYCGFNCALAYWDGDNLKFHPQQWIEAVYFWELKGDYVRPWAMSREQHIEIHGSDTNPPYVYNPYNNRCEDQQPPSS